MPRIVILVGDAKLSLRFVEALIVDLGRAGYEVDYLGSNMTDRTAAEVRALGAEPVECPLDRTSINPLADIRFLIWLVRYLRKRRPNVVLSCQPKPNIWGMMGATLAGIPKRAAMVTGLGFAFTDGDDRWRKMALRAIQSGLYATALRSVPVVFFQNRDDVAEFLRRRLVRKEQALLLGATGVVLEDWPQAPPHFEPFTFTLIARVLREKGVMEFVEAARIVRAHHPGVQFRLVGPLDSNPSAISEAEVRSWVEDGILEWVPWADDVRPFLAKTSVFVLPSWREGVPRSTQEAMAMGRPVITTDVPGCRETVLEGVNGFRVLPRDPKALAAAMLRFIDAPELVARMGCESRRLAEALFDARQINLKLIEALAL